MTDAQRHQIAAAKATRSGRIGQAVLIFASIVTDLSVGVRWGNYDLRLFGKNVLHEDAPLGEAGKARASVRRWFGISLSGRL